MCKKLTNDPLIDQCTGALRVVREFSDIEAIVPPLDEEGFSSASHRTNYAIYLYRFCAHLLFWHLTEIRAGERFVHRPSSDISIVLYEVLD